MTAAATPLRILIVEDDALIALVAEDYMIELGHPDVAVAPSVPAALEHIGAHPVDFALLDVNVKGGKVFPVADELRRRGVPFAFASGSGPDEVREDLRGYPAVMKPYQLADLERLLAR